MQDQGKFYRMLQILMSLTYPFGYTLEQIAERHEISKRTAYRYIDTFRSAGFIIDCNSSCYTLSRNTTGYKDLSELLHFSREESHVLQKAIHSIDENSMIKQNLVKKLYALYESESVARTIIQQSTGRNINLISDAIKSGRQVIFKNYSSANASKIRNRLVEPFAFTTNYISVWCYDTQKKCNRLFKTARIGEAEITDKAWQFRNRHKSSPVDDFRIGMKKQIPVQISLSLRARNLLAEEYPLAEEHITGTGNTYIYNGMVANFEGIGRFILGLMDEVTVLAPEELKEFLNKKIKNRKF